MKKKRYSLALRFFWITIFGLFVLWLLLFLKAQYHIFEQEEKKLQEQLQKEKKESILYEKLTLLASLAPKKLQEALEDPLFTQKLDKIIDEEIDKAFARVLDAIPSYLDFHYSLKGEYLELFAYSSDKGAKYLQKYLFENSNFETQLFYATQNIFEKSDLLVSETFKSGTQKLLDSVDLEEQESESLKKILDLQRQSTLERFHSELNLTLRASGVVAIGAVSAMMAKKIASKIAIKLSTKMGAATAGAASGASICAPTGAGAIICGALSGLAGWFGSDKVLIELDAHLNREDFHKELIRMVELERNKTKNSIKSTFSTLVEKSQKEYTKQIQQSVQERLKEKTLK